METNNKQCVDSALCTSTEEWINAAAKAMADRNTITFIEAVLKASPMEVHDLLAAEYRKAMKHALSHQWRDAREELPEDDEHVLTFVPKNKYGDLLNVAHIDGEDWYTIDGQLIRSSLWMRIPDLPKPEEK